MISRVIPSLARCRLAGLLALLAGIVVMGQLLPVQPAFAHASLVRSDPASNSVLAQPPSRVVIWFTEPLEPAFSQIRVLDAQGRQVDRGDSIVDRTNPNVMSVSLEPLDNGTYTVAWSNVSTVDGHRVRGSFVFSVGEPISGGPLRGADILPGPRLLLWVKARALDHHRVRTESYRPA